MRWPLLADWLLVGSLTPEWLPKWAANLSIEHDWLRVLAFPSLPDLRGCFVAIFGWLTMSACGRRVHWQRIVR